ncbi:S41 family peptidase [Rariglobus hedericola]|uniref:S41 family peptidase n=1 Tax=Rariglobus hedericola TaxID=2597822 RepID=A0A556QEP0_9BACT|nr:S41 family peptidase [Rariglobus hedericola]
MATVPQMLKRILVIASGVVLGVVLSVGVARTAAAWGWWPNRDLEKSTRYVREVLKVVNENYVDGTQADLPKLTEAALRGIVGSLDPHSEYMNARDYKTLEEEISSEFGGIGVQVELRKGNIVVIAPLPGTPGARAGMLRGDIIASIDGTKLDKPTLDETVGRLRGKPGTKVTIGFTRPSNGKEFEVTVKRERIKVESVRDVRMRPDGIGYVQITQFSERTGEEFIEALNTLNGQNMRGLIIDLRDNPGGLLNSAVEVAEPFFNKGELIVYTQGRKKEDRDEYRAAAPEPRLTIPVAVIINAGSASAAEIVSGALKDTRRAVIIGERSFGKGSVQSILPLREGEGLRLTTARYYTPSGVTIHEKGVSPDVEVVMSAEEDENVRLQRWRDDVSDAAEFKERFNLDPTPDRQLEAAVSVLQAALILETRANRSVTGPVAAKQP